MNAPLSRDATLCEFGPGTVTDAAVLLLVEGLTRAGPDGRALAVPLGFAAHA